MTNSDSPGNFVPPPFLFAAALALGVLIDGNALDWAHVTHRIQLIGIGVAVVGLVPIGAALGLFRKARTRPEPWMASSTLVTNGLYRFTRNPMYLGMATVSAGVALFFESIAGGVLLVGVVMTIDRLVIAREEAYLSRRFGADYDAYRQRVRRWL